MLATRKCRCYPIVTWPVLVQGGEKTNTWDRLSDPTTMRTTSKEGYTCGPDGGEGFSLRGVGATEDTDEPKGGIPLIARTRASSTLLKF